MIEVEQHDDAGFSVESRQSDDANPDGRAEIVAQDVEQPECADERERNCHKDDSGFDSRARVEVDEDKDQEEGERSDEQEPLESALLVFERAGPLNVIARGELHLLANALGSLLDVAANIVGRDIHKDKAYLL